MENEKKSGAWNIGWGWLVTIPLVTVVSWAISKGINETFCRQLSAEENRNPLDILLDRYVKGEIDKDEFDQKLQDIEQFGI